MNQPQHHLTDPASPEARVAIHQALYQSLLNNPTLGFWVVDENGRFLQVNDTYLRHSGYSRQEIMGLHIADISAPDVAAATAVYQATVKTKGHLLFETTHRTKEGDLWPVEINATYANGRFFAIIQDITHRKKVQSELRQKSDALENSLNGFDIIGADGKFLYANSAYLKMWGYDSLDEIIGTSPADHCADPAIPAQIIQHLEAEGTYTFVFTAKRKDGSTFEALMAAKKNVDDDGIVTYVGTTLDITEQKQTEKALRQSEDRFAKAFRLSPAALSLTRADGTLLDVNESYEKLTGYSREELIDRDATKLNIFTEVQRHDLRQRMAAAGLRLNEAELAIRTKSGDIRHVLYSVEVVDIDEESCALTLALDITARKQMELALEEMANNMATAQAMTHSGSWEIHLSPELEFIEPHIWSTECFRIFGLEADDTPVTQERFFNLVHPEDHEKISKLINEILETGEPVESEYRLIRPDGSMRTVLDSVMVVADEQTNRPVKLVGIVRDITESKQAKATIAQLNQRMKLILNSAGEGIYGADVNGRITFINPAMAHMVGREPAALQGQNAHTLFHHKYPDGSPYPAADCEIKTAVQKGKALHDKPDVFWHKDGSPVFVEYTTTPIYQTGTVVGSVTIVRDVTQRNKAAKEQALLAEQLRQAQKIESIGRLAGGVAHDFNNQLAVIELYGDLMRHNMDEKDPLMPKLEQIRQAAGRASNLTGQLLAFSRKQVLQPVVLNMNDLFSNLENMLGRLIGEDIVLSTKLQPNLWPVMADVGQMEQVIMNLIINARDAMPGGGMVTVKTSNLHADEAAIVISKEIPPSPCILLAITDTGHGMD